MPMLLTALIAGCAFLLGLRVGIVFGKRAQRNLSKK